MAFAVLAPSDVAGEVIIMESLAVDPALLALSPMVIASLAIISPPDACIALAPPGSSPIIAIAASDAIVPWPDII